MEGSKEKADSLRVQSAEHIITSDSPKLEVTAIRVFVQWSLFWISVLFLFTLLPPLRDYYLRRISLIQFLITLIISVAGWYIGYRAFTKVRELKKY